MNRVGCPKHCETGVMSREAEEHMGTLNPRRRFVKMGDMAKAPDVDFSASTFLYRGCEFFAAAEQVLDKNNLLNMPLYFLYFHTLELTMKAYLRFQNVPTKELKNKKGHDIVALYQDCRALGLVIDPQEQTNVFNIIKMLSEANAYEGLRYFNPKLEGLPSRDYTREIVKYLLDLVGSIVEPTPRIPEPATKLVFVFGKPQ
jgi:hypothetical protein